MRPLIAGFIALVLISTIEQKPVTDPPRTITERVVVGTPPGEAAAKQAKIDELNAECRRLADELRAVRMAHDKMLVKQVTPQVSPARQVPPAGARTLPPAGGGKWVDVPVYGPLGRQRGTRREWQSNQVQYRANCANGVCR
jgi:hypothetical protein